MFKEVDGQVAMGLDMFPGILLHPGFHLVSEIWRLHHELFKAVKNAFIEGNWHYN